MTGGDAAERNRFEVTATLAAVTPNSHRRSSDRVVVVPVA